ncbi:hypothetical protein CUD01_25290 [Cellulomonas uda]|uniref:Uncharacterized protein n=1 Tax=Cellulomonas uda TaxID=1714 RepID=A0A4Y3KG89_CELUD|nr:hypothetical protein CUD01_25290 [Cellulomonas uda]
MHPSGAGEVEGGAVSSTDFGQAVSEFFARFDRAILELPSGAFGGRPGDVAMRLTECTSGPRIVELRFDIGLRMRIEGEPRALVKKEEFVDIDLLEIDAFDRLLLEWAGRDEEFSDGAVRFIVASIERRKAALREMP